MVAAIARYHRRGLPKKRHESWQVIEGRENRQTVSSMALLLRLAAALDRRPAAVVAGLEVEAEGSRSAGTTGLAVRLLPTVAAGETPADLSLERWSLRSCAPAVLEASDLRLRVPEP
jgi:exopolyphosphatase/guanosine-5'-triphosphate,3'-diphosphate pyrophosphatase